MKVKPKLFLNMSPQTQEEGSLAFARNMKIDDDGNLISDYGYEVISSMASKNIVGHIVGLNNKIYFFCAVENQQTHVWGSSEIYEYDEVAKTATKINCAWTYSGGEIDGYVSTNQSGEIIITIGEYKEGGNVPIKHINLSYCAAGDDESIYCQAPKCPTANLILKNTYVKTIPNGVYVFFIRYKIRKDVYTNWFLCSRPIFGGTSEETNTLQGGLKHINLYKDSAKSFVFQLNYAVATNASSYSEFQLGFIITHDEATDARMWKHFKRSDFVQNPTATQNLIYFDYEDVEEANIDDLLESTYELYNVRNVTAFKNKLYISNYVESDFNPSDISALADKISFQVAHTDEDAGSYRNLKLNGTPLTFDYERGYYDEYQQGGQARDITELLTSKNLFNFDVTKLVKTSSKEVSDVLKFDVIWKGKPSEGGYDPDIAVVYNIYNNLDYKQVFGPDYDQPYYFTTTTYGQDDIIDTGMGIERAAMGTNLFVYNHAALEADRHPWYSLKLTFAFGSISERDAGVDFGRNGCSFFNFYTESLYEFDGHIGWCTRNSGFSDTARQAIENKLASDIKGQSFFAKAYLEITAGTTVYTIGYNSRMDSDTYAGYSNDLEVLNSSLFSTETLNSTLRGKIEDWVFGVLSNIVYLSGIDEGGTPVLHINGKDIRVNSIAVKFKKFDFDIESEDLGSEENTYYKRFKVSMVSSDYTSLCTFSFKSTVIEVDSYDNSIQMPTLMPLSTYQPYIHFVDEHNIVTNGVKLLLKQFTTGVATSNADVLYLKYKVENLSGTQKYKSFFISLVNVGDIVIEGFNYAKDPNNNKVHIIQCLELDAMLYNINDNITILIKDASGNTIDTITDGKYYSSGVSYPTLAFGNCGYVSFETQSNVNYAAYQFYIIISRTKSSENIFNLTKSSGYIPFQNTTGFVDVPDGYYGSWRCSVKKPSFDLCSDCYVSGSDIYAMNRTASLTLTNFEGYVQVQNSVTYFVRSNFNLNYLSLTEDINDSIFSIGSAASGVKQVAKVINSAILSYIYELKSMYRDFANKYFRPFDTDYKIDFDNTVRVSHVLSDETFNNSIFKFGPEDYYNVPTDRGIIVNLFTIGNNIFIHTKFSFYKFDGNQTLASSDNDIVLQESEPFSAGISQIFDSEYGYGGINNKEAGCITFDSYLFYDMMSNHIFAYGGNNQIQIVDATIYKLLSYYKPSYCRTLHDEQNHRVLFEFTTTKGRNPYYTFTISYNYRSKSFVSVHDLSLVNTLHSRYYSYSYKVRTSLAILFKDTATIDNTVLEQTLNVYKIYGNATTACMIQFGAEGQNVQSSPFNVAVVLFPQTTLRENVNNVKYIGDKIQDNYDEQSVYDVIKIPQATRVNPVSKFYIITDMCVSLPVTTDVDDMARPNTLLDYKGFKYDLGSWNSNYFRNALNVNNDATYKYPGEEDANGPGQPRVHYEKVDETPHVLATAIPNSDNYSLVYGKYFILVFDFIKNIPIKFEEVIVNSEKY